MKTADGYLLTLHRIPCGRAGCSGGKGTGQPVFLQHGLLSSSADWLLSGPERALAFILADAGYDVWLGNARGNTYSRKHVSMNSDETAFWDFSWHEMALYDVPAEIDFVYAMRELERNDTRKNLLYVGHSMGTTMAFVLLASRPEYNAKIQAVFAMAPVAFMGHVKSPIRLLAPFSHDIEVRIGPPHTINVLCVIHYHHPHPHFASSRSYPSIGSTIFMFPIGIISRMTS